MQVPAMPKKSPAEAGPDCLFASRRSVVGALAMRADVEAFTFSCFSETKPHRGLDDEKGYERHHPRPDGRDDDRRELDEKLAACRIGFRIGTESAERRRRHDRRSQRTDHASDAVNAEYVERVVIFQHRLQ